MTDSVDTLLDRVKWNTAKLDWVIKDLKKIEAKINRIENQVCDST